MARNRLLGIEIGSRCIKAALCSNNQIVSTAIMEIPEDTKVDDTIQDMSAVAGYISKMLGESDIRERNCALVLPDALVYTRKVHMPAMNDEQLRLNLPYEFRDFINDGSEKYNFDYSIHSVEYDEDGNPKSMEVMAAAAPKSLIYSCIDMMKKAGLNLVIALPESCAYGNLLTAYEASKGIEMSQEYCIIDIGYMSTHLHIYKGNDFEVSREIEYGCQAVERAVADAYDVGLDTAHKYLMENKDDCQNLEGCKRVYEMIAIEVMRAVNFYGFNSPGSNLKDAYFCGGGAFIEPLVESINSSSSLVNHRIIDLYDSPHTDKWLRAVPAAVGATYEE